MMLMEKMSVLIIEDDKDTANFFGAVLGMIGFECTLVHSVKQALSWLAVIQPEMILLDMRLGMELGGDDILYQIRSNPRFMNTRVIVITAYPDLAEPVTNLADLILLKPVEVEQLKTLASRLVGTSEHSRQSYFQDPLTDLYSRDFILTRLSHAFERFKRFPDFLFAVLVYTFDTQSVGLEPGREEDWDSILRLVGERLKKSYRPTDTIARLDYKHLGTLYEDLKRPEDIQVIINRLCGILAAPVVVEGRAYHLSPYIGAALHNPVYSKAEELMEMAYLALERSQQPDQERVQIID
jgi:PleD family two-component response regulator